MSLAATMRRAPQRAVTGAFILNSGIEKLRSRDDETAKGVHSMASNAFPAVGNVDPRTFAKMMGVGEVALGGALLVPIVPTAVAGLGLVAFAGGLLGIYWRNPSLHRDNDPRPTEQGVGIAKDVWLAGIGTSLVMDSMLSGLSEKRAETKGMIKGAAKGAKVAETASAAAAEARTALHEAAVSAREARKIAAAEARERAKAARKRVATQAQTAAAAARDTARTAAESARETAHTVKERVA